MLKQRTALYVKIPIDTKAKLSVLAQKADLSLTDVLTQLINRASPSYLLNDQKREFNNSPLIPPEIVRQIRRDHIVDKTPYRELSAKYGYALRTVYRACKGQGQYRYLAAVGGLGRPSKLSSAEIEEMADLYLLGEPCKNIAAAYGCGLRQAYRHIKRALHFREKQAKA